MHVRPHDPGREPRPHRDDESVSKITTPLATVSIGRDRQLRLSTVRSVRAVSVQMRTFLADGQRRFPVRPAAPLYVFGDQIPAVIEALTTAAAVTVLPVEPGAVPESE